MWAKWVSSEKNTLPSSLNVSYTKRPPASGSRTRAAPAMMPMATPYGAAWNTFAAKTASHFWLSITPGQTASAASSSSGGKTSKQE